jgi:DNA-directed RNA polymerase specialized sigma24 family protein
VLTLLAAVVQRRTPQAWKAVELVTAGLTLSEVAARLGVTRQAVGQRLGTALWHQEQAARPVAARLLAGAGGV